LVVGVSETEAKINKCVPFFLDRNKTLIDEFMKGNARMLVITQQMSAPVGVGVVRRAGNLEPLSVVKLILKRTNSSPSG
jgi:hypothetical protein